MGSEFDNWAGDVGAPALVSFQGEPITITPKGGSATPASGIVFRDELQTRATDSNKRLEYPLSVQVPMSQYPATQPNLGGDTIDLLVRKGDTRTARKTVSVIISQVGGMWHLALD